MKVLLLGLLRYNVPDKDTGQVFAGTNLHYVSPEVFFDNLDGVFGLYPAKTKIDNVLISKNALEDLEYPVLADLEFTSRITPKGKSVAVLSDIKVLKKLDIFK